ncbi:MAG TPA: hypothetical protein VLL75_10955 [Vicinamibacteria bacterium]|nr:hypothetical protein [Vicinamibacteria bacterium]
MQIRAAAVATLAALAWAGGVLARVAHGPELMATGRVLSTGNTSFAIATAQGLSIVFIVGTSTEVPPRLAAGSRVTVYYRALGERRRMAERVVLGAPSSPPAPDETPPAADRRGGPDAGSVPRSAGG